MVQKKSPAPTQSPVTNNLENQLPEGFQVAQRATFVNLKETAAGTTIIKGGVWIKYVDGGPNKFNPTLRNWSYQFKMPDGAILGVNECGNLKRLMTDHMVMGQSCFLVTNGKKEFFDKVKGINVAYWDFTIAPGPIPSASAQYVCNDITSSVLAAKTAPAFDLDLSL